MSKTIKKIRGEEAAMEIFQIVKKNKLLPTKLEDLLPLSYIGQAAVSFHREKIKLMKSLDMSEAQRKATLKDGQDAGEMLLNIEARIGELIISERVRVDDGQPGKPRDKNGRMKAYLPKGINKTRSHQSQQIAKNPKIVEKIKAKAKANEDIPTKTAVLSEIKFENEKKRRKQAEGKRQQSRIIMNLDQKKYINALDRCLSILPKRPPKDWDDIALSEATAKAKIIIRRLEVFDE